jgi:exonuclease III
MGAVHTSSMASPSQSLRTISPTHTNVTNVVNKISIRSWNINGDFVIKMNCPEFREELTKYNINLFQETHLIEDQASCIHLMQGYSLSTVEREYRELFRRQFGRVATLVRSQLGLQPNCALSSTDILVLESNTLTVVCVYILPEYHRWESFTNTDPFDKLIELMTILGPCDMPVLLLGDFNA